MEAHGSGSSSFSSSRPWLLQSSNATDNLSALALSFSIIFSILWYAWMFLAKKTKKEELVLDKTPLPPGPSGLPLVGNLLSLDPELHTYFAKLGRAYGPILKLHLGKKLGIVITSPDLARQVLKDQDTTFANRDVPAAGRALTYGGLDIVWTPYGPEWRMLRKVTVHKMLSNPVLDSVYSSRRKEIRKTVGYFYSQVGSPVNVGEQMFVTAMNVVTNMMWGGTVKDGKEKECLGSEFRQVVAEMTDLLGTPNLSDFFPGLAPFDVQGIVRKMKTLVVKFDKIFEAMIDRRLRIDQENGGVDESKDKDFLQVLLQMKDEEGAKMPFTMTHLKAIFMDLIIGGTDTTSNTIEFAMGEILNKPEVMKKIHEELDTVIGKESMVEEAHIQKLPFLNAVMKESLRLHPAVPLLVPHCPSETCNVGGYTVPKGSRVFINVWAIHRDPSIWKNPEEFDPDRFLNGKWDYSGNDFSYLPFGSGRRICAGNGMAERIILFLLASLLHSFEWKLSEGEKLDLSEKFGIVMKRKAPLVLVPTPRFSNPALYE